MKKLSNTETKLKKALLIKKACICKYIEVSVKKLLSAKERTNERQTNLATALKLTFSKNLFHGSWLHLKLKQYLEKRKGRLLVVFFPPC